MNPLKHVLVGLSLGVLVLGFASCKKEDPERCCEFQLGDESSDLWVKVCQNDTTPDGGVAWLVFVPPGTTWEEYEEELQNNWNGHCYDNE